MNLEVCYPDFVMWPESGNAANFFRSGCCEDTVSHTPFGQADIMPVEAAPAAMRQYKMLIMSGWNTMTSDTQSKLMRYVRQGGTLAILLPQMTAATCADDPCAHINPRRLRELCGVELAGAPDRADAPINRLAIPAGLSREFPETERLIRRQPATPFYMHLGTYNAQLRNLRLAGRRARAIATESFSGFPFLVEHRLGSGWVYLFNLADYSKSPAVYLVINAALRDLCGTVAARHPAAGGRKNQLLCLPRRAACRRMSAVFLWLPPIGTTPPARRRRFLQFTAKRSRSPSAATGWR